MPGQFAVHECEIRIEQVEQAAVLTHNGMKKFDRLAIHGIAQGRCEARKALWVGLGGCVQFTDSEPLTREIFGKRFGFWIKKHSVDLLLESFRVVQPVLLRQLEQLRVWHRGPNEVRKT